MFVIFSMSEVYLSDRTDRYLDVWDSATLVTRRVSHARLLKLIDRLGVESFSDNLTVNEDGSYFIGRRGAVSDLSYNSLGWNVSVNDKNIVRYNGYRVNLTVGAADTYNLTLRINKKKYVLAHVADTDDLHVDSWVYYCDNLLSFSHVEIMEDMFILHFDGDYCVVAVDMSGVPLGVFNSDKTTFVADICDKRLVKFSAKRGMFLGEGWWRDLITPRSIC